MGMSSDAHIFLGCSLMDTDSPYGEGLHPSLEHWREEINTDCKYETSFWDSFCDDMYGGLHKPFGLPYPPSITNDLEKWRAWKEEYKQIPVEIRSVAGFYEFPSHAMVVIRTFQTASEYGLVTVDLSKLFSVNATELAAYNKALDFIGFTGDREIRCLMGADYG